MKKLPVSEYVQATFSVLTIVHDSDHLTKVELIEALDNASMMSITTGWLMREGVYSDIDIWETFQSKDFIKLCVEEVDRVFYEQ